MKRASAFARLPLVPSARMLALLLALAPVALVVAATAPDAWTVAPAAALALMLVMLLDGWLAGPLAGLFVTAPHDAEAGQPVPVRVLAQLDRVSHVRAPEAALSLDVLLGGDGSSRLMLTGTEPAGHFSGETFVIPKRRGVGRIDGVWLRWGGPLGLGLRQMHRSLDLAVRVWPDLSPTRSPTLQAFLRDAQYGLVARRLRGEGTQFEALAEYEAGMDRRRIDWKASARHTALYARENEAERDNQIVLAFDCGAAMSEPVDGLPRLDRALSTALMAAYVALKGGDRVALFGFADRPSLLTPFVTDTRSFHRLRAAAAELDYVPREPNFTLALATLATRLKRRSLIVLFSDFSDPTSAELMVESVERLVRRHLVIFVTLADTELDNLVSAPPKDIGSLATAVAVASLMQQRTLVLQRLRHLGVDVIEAPWQKIGFRLIDRYLTAKRQEAVG